MLTGLISRIWKKMPPGMRTFLTRRLQPTFTVSAAGIITNERGEVLLLNHVLRPASGWGVPGGFLAAGEQPETAFRREVKEETGIEVSDVTIYKVHTLKRHVEIVFTARGRGKAAVGSREITELGWFAVEDIPAEMNIRLQFMIRKALGHDDQ